MTTSRTTPAPAPAPLSRDDAGGLFGQTNGSPVRRWAASLAEKQYKKYERSSARTDYLGLEGRPHLLMAAEGWNEVAASIESWLDGVLDATAKTLDATAKS